MVQASNLNTPTRPSVRPSMDGRDNLLECDSDGISSPIGPASPPRLPLLAGVTILVGIGAGVGGMLLALLLHLVQRLAFGYGFDATISPETFLQGVSAASPIRRVMVLGLCGLVAGSGWWAVYRFGRPLVGIGKAVHSDDPRMPMGSTIAHAILQIVTVALGSPLGREVAPREIAAALAGWLSHRFGLQPEDSRLMVACGAGAGLAAVYNVPFAGALFILEVVLGTFRMSEVIPAVTSCTLAALVAWIGLGDQHQYTVPTQFGISSSFVILSALAGPIFGAAAFGFTRVLAIARKRAPKDARLILLCIPVYVMIGFISIYFPGLLGNGKGPTQLGYGDELSVGLALGLLLLKLLAITGSLRAGAEGGLLTPALTIGALMAIVIGEMWNLVLPGADVPSSDLAIVGSAAFLAASMNMPMTATALIFEFTHIDQDFLFPNLFSL
jgi:H+/Cl- antiporter ClcA